jgi:hypothetical protein
MQQQAVRSPSTDWQLQQSFRRSFERLRGRAGDSYVGPETAQRTHDLHPELSDTIDPRPGLSDQKFAKTSAVELELAAVQTRSINRLPFLLRQSGIYAMISSGQKLGFERRWARARGRARTGFGTLGGQPAAKGEGRNFYLNRL